MPNTFAQPVPQRGGETLETSLALEEIFKQRFSCGLVVVLFGFDKSVLICFDSCSLAAETSTANLVLEENPVLSQRLWPQDLPE